MSFRDDLDRMNRAMSDRLAIPIEFTGWRQGDFRGGPDPERPPFVVRGTYSRAPGVMDLNAARMPSGASTRALHSRNEISITAEDAAAMPWKPEDGDRAVADGQTLTVVAVLTSTYGGLQILAGARTDREPQA